MQEFVQEQKNFNDAASDKDNGPNSPFKKKQKKKKKKNTQLD